MGSIGFGVIEVIGAVKVLQFFAAVKIVHIAILPKRRSFKIKSESGH